MFPVRSGANFPFPWPGLNHSSALFLAASQQFCAELSTLLFKHESPFHKNLVLHIPANVPGCVAMAISVRLRWHSMILGLRYMQPPPLASLIQFCQLMHQEIYFSTASQSSAFPTFIMYHYISTGEKKNYQAFKSLVFIGSIFPFGKKRGEFRTRRNQEMPLNMFSSKTHCPVY